MAWNSCGSRSQEEKWEPSGHNGSRSADEKWEEYNKFSRFLKPLAGAWHSPKLRISWNDTVSWDVWLEVEVEDDSFAKDYITVRRPDGDLDGPSVWLGDGDWKSAKKLDPQKSEIQGDVPCKIACWMHPETKAVDFWFRDEDLYMRYQSLKEEIEEMLMDDWVSFVVGKFGFDTDADVSTHSLKVLQEFKDSIERKKSESAEECSMRRPYDNSCSEPACSWWYPGDNSGSWHRSSSSTANLGDDGQDDQAGWAATDESSYNSKHWNYWGEPAADASLGSAQDHADSAGRAEAVDGDLSWKQQNHWKDSDKTRKSTERKSWKHRKEHSKKADQPDSMWRNAQFHQEEDFRETSRWRSQQAQEEDSWWYADAAQETQIFDEEAWPWNRFDDRHPANTVEYSREDLLKCRRKPATQQEDVWTLCDKEHIFKYFTGQRILLPHTIIVLEEVISGEVDSGWVDYEYDEHPPSQPPGQAAATLQADATSNSLPTKSSLERVLSPRTASSAALLTSGSAAQQPQSSHVPKGAQEAAQEGISDQTHSLAAPSISESAKDAPAQSPEGVELQLACSACAPLSQEAPPQRFNASAAEFKPMSPAATGKEKQGSLEDIYEQFNLCYGFARTGRCPRMQRGQRCTWKHGSKDTARLAEAAPEAESNNKACAPTDTGQAGVAQGLSSGFSFSTVLENAKAANISAPSNVVKSTLNASAPEFTTLRPSAPEFTTLNPAAQFTTLNPAAPEFHGVNTSVLGFNTLSASAPEFQPNVAAQAQPPAPVRNAAERVPARASEPVPGAQDVHRAADGVAEAVHTGVGSASSTVPVAPMPKALQLSPAEEPDPDPAYMQAPARSPPKEPYSNPASMRPPPRPPPNSYPAYSCAASSASTTRPPPHPPPNSDSAYSCAASSASTTRPPPARPAPARPPPTPCFVGTASSSASTSASSAAAPKPAPAPCFVGVGSSIPSARPPRPTAHFTSVPGSTASAKPSSAASSSACAAEPRRLPNSVHANSSNAAGAGTDLVTEVQRILAEAARPRKSWRTVLGLDPAAQVDDAVKKYKKLMLRLHPDKRTPEAVQQAGGLPKIDKAFQEVQKAKEDAQTEAASAPRPKPVPRVQQVRHPTQVHQHVQQVPRPGTFWNSAATPAAPPTGTSYHVPPPPGPPPMPARSGAAARFKHPGCPPPEPRFHEPPRFLLNPGPLRIVD